MRRARPHEAAHALVGIDIHPHNVYRKFFRGGKFGQFRRRAGLRMAAKTSWPERAIATAVANPIPVLHPVISAIDTKPPMILSTASIS